jgi:hypothetical protein
MVQRLSVMAAWLSFIEVLTFLYLSCAVRTAQEHLVFVYISCNLEKLLHKTFNDSQNVCTEHDTYQNFSVSKTYTVIITYQYIVPCLPLLTAYVSLGGWEGVE